MSYDVLRFGEGITDRTYVAIDCEAINANYGFVGTSDGGTLRIEDPSDYPYPFSMNDCENSIVTAAELERHSPNEEHAHQGSYFSDPHGLASLKDVEELVRYELELLRLEAPPIEPYFFAGTEDYLLDTVDLLRDSLDNPDELTLEMGLLCVENAEELKRALFEECRRFESEGQTDKYEECLVMYAEASSMLDAFSQGIGDNRAN